MENKKNSQPWYARQKTLLIAIIMLLIWIALVVVYMAYNKFKIGETGSIGDAFNGLIAPFISLFAAFLVYISFREQYKANKLQYKANKMLESQWIFDTYLSLFREVEDEYNNLSIIYWDNGVAPAARTNKKGLEGFTIVIEHGVGSGVIQGAVPMFENLKEPLEELIYLINEINKSEFSQKHFLAYKILRFYNKNLNRFNTKNAENTDRT